jgi:hypothetical protein
MLSLKVTLMQRDRISAREADKLIDEAKLRVLDGADPEQVLRDDFGLEPDFIFDIVP